MFGWRWRRPQRAGGAKLEDVAVERNSRFLVVAPHSDDEVLGAGGLIYRAVKLGCPVHVVMLTNGDGYNRAALRSQSRRLRMTPTQAVAFAYARQQETLAALARLGLQSSDVTFLGYPDRGLAAMWERHWHVDNPFRSRFIGVTRSPYYNSRTLNAPFSGVSLVEDLEGVMAEFRPTHLIVPHPNDFHGDHWAGCCFALFALERLRLAGLFSADVPVVLQYLVHQGPWPRPKGFRPSAGLHPPPTYAGLRFPWVTLPLAKDAIAHKHDALLSYESQMVFMRGYLLSFVRSNELFGLAETVRPPLLPRGGFADREPGEGSWSDGEVLYPTRDSLAKRVGRSADVKALRIGRDDERLYLQMELRHRAVDDYVYGVTLFDVPFQAEGRRRLHIGMRVPDRLQISGEGGWELSEGIVGRTGRRAFEVALPLSALDGCGRLFLGAETRYRGLVIDRLALQLLDLESSD